MIVALLYRVIKVNTWKCKLDPDWHLVSQNKNKKG